MGGKLFLVVLRCEVVVLLLVLELRRIVLKRLLVCLGWLVGWRRQIGSIILVGCVGELLVGRRG